MSDAARRGATQGKTNGVFIHTARNTKRAVTQNAESCRAKKEQEEAQNARRS